MQVYLKREHKDSRIQSQSDRRVTCPCRVWSLPFQAQTRQDILRLQPNTSALSHSSRWKSWCWTITSELEPHWWTTPL